MINIILFDFFASDIFN